MSSASGEEAAPTLLDPRRLVPILVALGQALIVLGPALRPGVAVRYDMAWSPDPRWTPFVLGLDTPAPRAVPSDAVAVLVGQVVGAGVAQKLILVGILVALGMGAAHLVGVLAPTAGVPARTAATVAAVWNPYVHERLMVGQWTVLLGLAVLPWALARVIRVGRGESHLAGLGLLVVLAGLGGANTLAVVLSAALPALLLVAVVDRGRRSPAHLLVTVLVAIGMAAAWALPAVRGGAGSAGPGADAFVPVADTPLGVLGSLASGGGFWNTAVHPDARQVLLLALVAALVMVTGVITALACARGNTRWTLAVAVGVPASVVLVSVVPALEPVWRLLVTGVPGGGLLRDSHKFIGPWVLLGAVGLGLVVASVGRRVRPALAGPLTVLLLLLPVALAPFAAWGGLGQLTAVVVPTEFRTAMAQVNAAPAGDVGLLPWNQYRRYPWNDDRVSLTLAPRMLTRVVLFDDSLPLRSGVVPGESDAAAGVTAAIEAGESPVDALAATGVRYLVLERTAAGTDLEADLRTVGRVLVETGEVLVVDLGEGRPAAVRDTTAAVAGWAVTLSTALAAAGSILLARRTRRGAVRRM